MIAHVSTHLVLLSLNEQLIESQRRFWSIWCRVLSPLLCTLCRWFNFGAPSLHICTVRSLEQINSLRKFPHSSKRYLQIRTLGTTTYVLQCFPRRTSSISAVLLVSSLIKLVVLSSVSHGDHTVKIFMLHLAVSHPVPCLGSVKAMGGCSMHM